MSTDDINKRFNYHPSDSPQNVADHKLIRGSTKELASLYDALPDGREKSLALTKLEEALFWANAAIARN